MKKLLSLLLALTLLCSLTIPAFADTTIDTTRTGSVDLWKYDLHLNRNEATFVCLYLPMFRHYYMRRNPRKNFLI